MYHEEFRLTGSHVKLLQKMYCDFNDDAYDGAPMVDIKRPYGNSDVVSDVYELIFSEDHHFEFDDEEYNGGMPEHLANMCMELHRETGKALQVCLSTLSFKPGLYGRPNKYDKQKWVWISE